ncbi:MAG: JAB domain-containing protein [Ginsengibacter sp.]
MEQTMIDQPNWCKVAEVELVYNPKIKASERPHISCSRDSFHILRNIWDDNKINMQKQFKVLLLNRANNVIGLYNASSGGITGTIVDARLILALAIKSLSVSIILSHNHPSGNLKRSLADEELTGKIKKACSYHDIKVLDHLIVTSEGYYSFADEGLL